jgi:hypothetical protein
MGSSLALTGRCPVCQRRVDRGSGLCGNCLTKRGAQWSIVAMLVCFAGAFYWNYLHPRGTTPILMADPVADAAIVPPAAPRRDFDGWAYAEIRDPVLGDLTQTATVLGQGPAPNSGRHTATLQLSSSAHYGKRVTITFPKVEQACDANQCQVSVAWDDAAPDPYRFDPPIESAAGDKTVLQTDEFNRFTDALGKAHSLKIVASLGMRDDYVMKFPVAGFEPQKYQ